MLNGINENKRHSFEIMNIQVKFYIKCIINASTCSEFTFYQTCAFVRFFPRSIVNE